MPYTTDGKNVMLDALANGRTPALQVTHVGILRADAGKSVTGTASTDVFTSTAHGYSNGDRVLLSGLTGGAGLVAGRLYFIIASSTDRFQVALTSGGSAVDFTSDLSAGTVTRIVELSGGSPAYARKAIAFNTAAAGSVDDSTNGAVIDVPASSTTDQLGFYSASSAGTLLAFTAPSVVETFVGQGTYTVTDADLDLMATA